MDTQKQYPFDLGDVVIVRDLDEMMNDQVLKKAGVVDKNSCLGISRKELKQLREQGAFTIRKIDYEDIISPSSGPLGPRTYLEGTYFFFCMRMLEPYAVEDLAELTDDEIALFVGAE